MNDFYIPELNITLHDSTSSEDGGAYFNHIKDQIQRAARTPELRTMGAALRQHNPAATIVNVYTSKTGHTITYWNSAGNPEIDLYNAVDNGFYFGKYEDGGTAPTNSRVPG